MNMIFIEIIKSIIFGIIEGITEWLPVSSTGHLILFKEILSLNMTNEFYELFQVVIQFGAIFAVVIVFFDKICPINRNIAFDIIVKKDVLSVWINIIISCIPAVIVGLICDEFVNKYFYNYIVVSISLIVIGIVFIYIERIKEGAKPNIIRVTSITPRIAFYIGLFQIIAALFPGTSRSGITILGALLLGVSRSVAVEYTFYLAIPVMVGASIFKIFKYIFKYGIDITKLEMLSLIVATLVAFLVSLFVIKSFILFVKKHTLTIFGYYRIILGTIVLFVFNNL